jgi:hypothetical protein
MVGKGGGHGREILDEVLLWEGKRREDEDKRRQKIGRTFFPQNCLFWTCKKEK